MANGQLVALLKQGPYHWNAWRQEHPDVTVDLCGADLRKLDLHGADLQGVDLRHANLSGANCSEVNFR
jgi:uncharacterized protein YjbI with pentapeptide repeats